MIKLLTTLTLLLAGALLIACAPLNAVRMQQEKTQSIELGNEVLFAAALDFCGAQGWAVDTTDEGLGLIEALGPVDESAGMTTRERWRISTRDGEIGIVLDLEYLANGKWHSESVVCHTYSYARESLHLATIANLAKGRAKTQVAIARPGGAATPPAARNVN